MKTDKMSLWPTLVHHARVEMQAERLWLLQKLDELKIYNCLNTAGQRGNTTRAGYQPDYDFFQDSSPEMHSIYEKIIRPLSEDFWRELSKNNIQIAENLRLIHKCWLVEYSQGTWQDLHNHKSSLFTGVWTVYNDEQLPGHAEFQIHNPNIISHNLGFVTAVKKISTIVDDVYIIPAWVYHNVTPASARRVVFVWDSIAVPVDL